MVYTYDSKSWRVKTGPSIVFKMQFAPYMQLFMLQPFPFLIYMVI